MLIGCSSKLLLGEVKYSLERTTNYISFLTILAIISLFFWFISGYIYQTSNFSGNLRGLFVVLILGCGCQPSRIQLQLYILYSSRAPNFIRPFVFFKELHYNMPFVQLLLGEKRCVDSYVYSNTKRAMVVLD